MAAGGQYRPDIDGLRFLAVAPVVLFHAGISGFSGGYVGVDVFFVISGYLITNILLGEMDRGEFSIVRFYERRIRRIFPALFAMIAFVCLVAPLALLPSELRELPKEIVGALAFVANIVFWMQSGYFGADAEQKPLLHTWSLGVEEQFYIFAPVILWLLVRYCRRGVPLALTSATIISFALCVYFTPIKSSAAFYLLPFRAWELLIGSVLATGLPRMRRATLNEGAAMAGVCCLLVAIFSFSEHTVFPGYAAALPVLGSALIIQFAKDTVTGRLLGSRPLVFIGLISYSLYLWHWPLIVFFRDWGLLEGLTGRCVVVLLSFVAAWASWKFIETPFRISTEWPRRRLFWGAAVGTGVLMVGAAGLHFTDGWPSRLDPKIVALDEGRYDISPERERCHFNAGDPSFESLCRLGIKTGARAETIVWGDSHAVELAAALGEAGRPLVQATYSSCPPSLGYTVKARPLCKQHNNRMLMAIKANDQIRTVILSAYYIKYPDQVSFLSGMQQTIAQLTAANKRVIVIGPFPNFGGVDIPSYTASGSRAELRLNPVPPGLERAMAGAEVISVLDRFCRNDACNLIIDGKPLLFDNNHLSMTAARHIAPIIVAELQEK